MAESERIRNKAAFIQAGADLLRGNDSQSEHGKVIPPVSVTRRRDCVLEPIKPAVRETDEELVARIENVQPMLRAVTVRSSATRVR